MKGDCVRTEFAPLRLQGQLDLSLRGRHREAALD